MTERAKKVAKGLKSAFDTPDEKKSPEKESKSFWQGIKDNLSARKKKLTAGSN